MCVFLPLTATVYYCCLCGCEYRNEERRRNLIAERICECNVGIYFRKLKLRNAYSPFAFVLCYSTNCKTYICAMNDLLQRITSEPGKLGGKPCVRGMRIRVVDVLELLASGMTQNQILEEHPDLEAEDIKACLIFAAQRSNYPYLKAA